MTGVVGLLSKYGEDRHWTRYGPVLKVVKVRTRLGVAELALLGHPGEDWLFWVTERTFKRFYREVPNPARWGALTEEEALEQLRLDTASLYHPLFRDDPHIDADCPHCHLIRLNASGLCPSCGYEFYL